MRVFVSIAFTLLFCAPVFLKAQTDTLLSISGKPFSSDEFLRVYNKNIDITPEADKKDLDEYLDLFINYKLKVIEAQAKGYDTLPSFISEFDGYRRQLAQPYLENKSYQEKLIQEAFERSLIEIDASHILIKCDEFASPKDTLKAYEKIAAIRARVLGGEPFDQIASAVSDDPSAAENKGHLGYFTVFRMVYPFETAAYNTPAGQVSAIVRTSFGYHLIKVHNRRNSRGSVKVAHIMTRIPEGASEPEKMASKEKIERAYQDLQNGKPWNDAVKEYSENPRSVDRNGEIGWLRTGQAPEEFLDPCFKLNNGEYTSPIETKGGYHIGYVLAKYPMETFEEAEERITKQVERDNIRKATLKQQQFSELKNQYPVTIYAENIAELLSLMDSSFYQKKWDATKASGLNKEILHIGDSSYSQYDFALYLGGRKARVNKNQSFETNLRINLEEYADAKLYDYAMANLQHINVEYKNLLEEYHDGILLFNITNDMVWDRAQTDTSGLEAFYQQANKYKWNERIGVNIYTYTDSSFTAALPALLKKQQKKGDLGIDYLQTNLCGSDTIACITLEKKIYEKGIDAMADKLTWKKSTYLVEKDQALNYFFYVAEIWPVSDKKLDEAKGLYISDYQNYLENEWMKELRNKNQIEINTPLFEKLKAEANK